MFNTSIASIEIAAVRFKPHGRFFYSSTDGKQFVVSGVQRYPPDGGSLYRHIPCRAYGRRGGCVQYEYFPARRCSRCLYKQRMVIRLHTFSAQLFTHRYTNHSPVLRICRNHDPQVFCSFCLVVDRDPDCQLSVLINTRSGHINCLCKYRPYCSVSGIVSKQVSMRRAGRSLSRGTSRPARGSQLRPG